MVPGSGIATNRLFVGSRRIPYGSPESTGWFAYNMPVNTPDGIGVGMSLAAPHPTLA